MVYKVVIRLGRVVFWLLGLRIDLDGADRVPRSGAAILAANHVSFLDFLLVGLIGEERGRRVRFLAREDLWDHRVVGWAMDRMGHIPVDRAAPAHAYLLAREALRRGEIVGIFPEAGISPAYVVRALMPGAAALARDTGAVLLPVGVWGGQRLLPVGGLPRPVRRVPISIVVGSPVTPQRDVESTTRLLGARLHGLLERLQRDPRQLPAPGTSPLWHPAHFGGGAMTVSAAATVVDLPRTAVTPTWGPVPPPDLGRRAAG